MPPCTKKTLRTRIMRVDEEFARVTQEIARELNTTQIEVTRMLARETRRIVRKML